MNMLVDVMRSVVRTGEVIDLGQVLDEHTPHHPNHPPFMYRLTKEHGDTSYSGGVSASNDVIVMGTHVGTHIDGFAHIAVEGTLVGGRKAAELGTRTHGYREIGIDRAKPIVGRGVLIDVAAFKGVDCLEPGYAIVDSELAAACASQGVTIEEGDSVLLRTGWQKHWGNPRKYVGLAEGSPGPDGSAARWLAEHGIVASGSDTLVYEMQPAPTLPVHVEFLVNRGIHIMECMNLDELAARKAWTFLFVALPLKIAGGTGSPIRPVAVI
jgi:kynurenine formamidase